MDLTLTSTVISSNREYLWEKRKQKLYWSIVVIDNRNPADTYNIKRRSPYTNVTRDLSLAYPRAWERKREKRTATLAGFSYRYSCSTSWYRSLFIASLFLSPFVPGTRRSPLSVSFSLSSSLSVGRWFLFLRVLIRVGGRSPPPHSLSASSLPLPSMLRRYFGSRFLCSHGPSREQRRSTNVRTTLYTS